MIQFNELRITPDEKRLIIDISVPDESYYENVYIEDIIIDNQDTYVENGPSSKPVYQYSVHGRLSVFTNEQFDSKHARLELTSADLPLNGLLFVYARAGGVPAPDTPCGMDNLVTMRTVTDLYPLYQQAMSYINELSDTCNIPKELTNYILKLKGLDLAVKTGNYTEAVNYYNKFFNGKTAIPSKRGGCGCGNY